MPRYVRLRLGLAYLQFLFQCGCGSLTRASSRRCRCGGSPAWPLRETLRAFATVAGAESAVSADAIKKAVRQLPGLAGLTNPAAASGGAALESDAAAIQRGPAVLKARGRAVTAGDVAVLALAAEAVSITRAWALGGVDATMGGVVRPGAIGVFVIPARRADDPADEPVRAGSEALAAVARYLSGVVGPVLARVTVGNPAFHRIRIEANLSCRAGADLGAAAAAAEAAINRWLDPESDGGGQRQFLRGLITHAAVGAARRSGARRHEGRENRCRTGGPDRAAGPVDRRAAVCHRHPGQRAVRAGHRRRRRE